MLAAALLCGARTVHAQVLDPTIRFSTQRFRPAYAPINYVQTEGARTLGHLNFSAGLYLDYTHRPLVAFGVDLIKHQINFNLMLAVGFWDRLEIAVGLPVTAFQSGDDAGTPLSGHVGDLRFQAKLRLVTARFFSLAIALPVEAPTGSVDNFLGGTGWTLTPRAMFSFDWSRVTFALNAGYRAMIFGRRFDLGTGQIAHFDDEFQAGAGIKVIAVPKLMDVMLDAQVGIGIYQQNDEERYSELLGAFRFHLPHGLKIDVGGGPGLSRGLGTPAGRVFAGLFYHYDKRDRDKDGIWDDVDKCPDDPEDKDGFEDADGCPDPDNDKDGIPDKRDACPNEPENVNGIDDEDGCPEKDSDGDGIFDPRDKCPQDPEDKDGFQDDDGCPDPDNDKDTLLDPVDKCPNDPEDKDGFDDDDGCADTDNDKDGILDKDDKCPNEPETKNSYQDEDGCPDTVPTAVKKFEGTIEGITFEFKLSTIRPSSYKTLDAAAKVMKDYPDLKILIRGHTDSIGDESRNKTLSLDRAEAVKKYLVDKGIAAERITTEGLSFNEPIADNKHSSGRAKNRRIEFRRQP
jgi:large repetitive protein